MSFTPTSKNFDQNRNHIMKNQTNPTHLTQQHNTWNFIKNETLTEQKLKESNISSLNLIRNETLTEPQTSKLEKIILFIHIHTYIHTYIHIYREREYQGVPRRDRAWRGDQRCWERRGGALFSSPWICFWFQNSDSDQSIVCDSNLIKSSSSSFGFGFVALLWEFWFRFAVKEREWERELEVLGEEVVWVSLRFVIRWFVRVWAFKAQFDCSKNWASSMFSSYNGLN